VLARDEHALVHGQWWRLVTPLLVQTLGWYQVLANLATLPVVGVVAEDRLGRAGWIVCAASGTAGGQLSAYAQHEPGGGDSILIAGLAGGMLVHLVATGRRAAAPRWYGIVALGYLAALTGWSVRGAWGAAVAGTLTVALLAADRRLEVPGALAARLIMALLAVRGDLHGAACTAGAGVAAVGWCLRRAQRPPDLRHRPGPTVR
jgi:hypothetical protein